MSLASARPYKRMFIKSGFVTFGILLVDVGFFLREGMYQTLYYPHKKNPTSTKRTHKSTEADLMNPLYPIRRMENFKIVHRLHNINN